MALPQRKVLPHDPPLGIPSEDATFFITICAAARGSDDLVSADRGRALIDAVKHRQDEGVWWCRVFVAMPDHVHGLIRFPFAEHVMTDTVAQFKKYTARTMGILWQKDFFDHRLRHDESEREKADYILRNPVRAGLVEDWERWPYFFVAQDGI